MFAKSSNSKRKTIESPVTANADASGLPVNNFAYRLAADAPEAERRLEAERRAKEREERE